MVEMLLEAGADVNAEMYEDESDDERQTPLLAAIKAGHERVVDLLLRYVNDIRFQSIDHEGWHALETAMAYGHSGIVSKLLRAGAGDPLDRSIYALYECGRRGDNKKAQSLISVGIDVAHLLDALPEAIPGEKAQLLTRNIVSKFLKVCDDPNVTGVKYGKTALCLAVEVGEWDLIRPLIQHGATVNCIISEHGPILQIFLDYCDDGQSVWRGGKNNVAKSLDALKMMLNNGADPNSPVAPSLGDANTILELAFRSGGKHASELARLLLDHGAKISGDENVISEAILGHCDLDVIEWLIDGGAVVNPPPSSYNPLQAAIIALGDDGWPYAVDVIKLLLDRGADINAPATTSAGLDELHLTALQGADYAGHMGIAQLLLQQGG